MPEDVVPATLKAQKAKTLGLGGAESSSPAGRFGGREGRSYGEKAGAPAAGQRPRFEGGAGGYQRGGSGGFAGAPPARA